MFGVYLTALCCLTLHSAETADVREWLAGPGSSAPSGVWPCALGRPQVAAGRTLRCADTPYAALLLRQGEPAPCAGALVSPTAVLSAAQCHATRAMVAAGNSQYLYEEDFLPPTQYRVTTSCIVFDPKNITVYDIMVCLVHKPFMESVYVGKINVVESPVNENVTCIVTGFGLIDDFQNRCLVSRSIMQRIPDRWDCPGAPSRGPSSVCTSDTKAQAVCPGDMGAAAICRVGGKLSLVGVAAGVVYASGDSDACPAGVTGNIYTQVHVYTPWLKALVRDLQTPLAQEPQPPWLADRCAGLHKQRCRHQAPRSGAARAMVPGASTIMSFFSVALGLLMGPIVSTSRQTNSSEQICCE